MSEDHVEDYLKSINNYPRITVERERVLSDIIQNGKDTKKIEKAREEFIQANLALVVSRAKKFMKRYHGSLSFMDIVEEGNIGLVRAVDLYDIKHSSNVVFGTYASYCIDSKIQRAIHLDAMIHIPVAHYKYQYELKKLEDKYGEELTDEIIIKELAIFPTYLEAIRDGVKSKSFSIEDWEFEGQRSHKRGYYGDIKWEDVVGVDTSHIENLHRDLCGYIKKLKPRDQKIVEDIYFNSYTQQEVSEKHKVCRSRIGYIQGRCLRQIRCMMEEDWDSTHDVISLDEEDVLVDANKRMFGYVKIMEECMKRDKVKYKKIMNFFLEGIENVCYTS